MPQTLQRYYMLKKLIHIVKSYKIKFIISTNSTFSLRKINKIFCIKHYKTKYFLLLATILIYQTDELTILDKAVSQKTTIFIRHDNYVSGCYIILLNRRYV